MRPPRMAGVPSAKPSVNGASFTAQTQEQFFRRLFTMQPLAHTVGMAFQDHFSAQADAYARFRPTCPDALSAWLVSRVPTRALAWDCGTGSGQAAVALAAHFTQVIASDPGREQPAHAAAHARGSGDGRTGAALVRFRAFLSGPRTRAQPGRPVRSLGLRTHAHHAAGSLAAFPASQPLRIWTHFRQPGAPKFHHMKFKGCFDCIKYVALLLALASHVVCNRRGLLHTPIINTRRTKSGFIGTTGRRR
jgi:hypothetical protein